MSRDGWSRVIGRDGGRGLRAVRARRRGRGPCSARDQAPRSFLDALIEAGEFPDAVRFLAHALPKREAVWWACLCAREAAGADPPEPVAAALRAAEAWVADPSEENRRAAVARGRGGRAAAPPAGCAAAAAFWSGGSLGPARRPGRPPRRVPRPRTGSPGP